MTSAATVSVCKNCNRVKIGDEEWSENPSTKVSPKTKNVNVVDECVRCSGSQKGSGSTPPSPEAKAVATKKDETAVEKDFETLATENHMKLVTCKKMMGAALLKFAAALRECYENNYWKINHDSWNEYLATDEIGIERSRASILMKLSRAHTALETQLDRPVSLEEIAEGRYRKLLPCVVETDDGIEDPEGIAELIEKARTLGGDDFESEVDQYRENRGIEKQDRPPVERRIADGGPVMDADGNKVGKLKRVTANEKIHILTIYLGNEHVPDGEITLVIP